MSEECSHTCESCGKDCSERTKESLLEKPHEGCHVKKVIGVVSGKGGVGKSLVTSMLAVMTQRKGYQAAILDADITGPSIPQMLGLHTHASGTESGIYPVKSKTGIRVMSLNLLMERETDPVVWRGPIIAGTVKQFWTDVIWGDVDYMFIDMPPGTGDVPLTVFQSIPVDGLVIVASPQELVGMIVEKAVNMAGIMNIPVLALVENMSYIVCPDCGREIRVFGESRIAEIAKKHFIENTARLSIDPKLAAACDAGMIELFDGNWLNEILDTIIK
ncbi:MAG: P-loop NTPase [Oscillospiraceae bacterium]|nr:P-loop NTPase [Oscillospiraceae bacterium]